VSGQPSFTLDLQMNDNHDDHVNAACLATAMRLINAVPAVVNARAGHISIYDLPLLTGRFRAGA
jgi:4-hydroxy-tetrahydrodipicolinate reductase